MTKKSFYLLLFLSVVNSTVFSQESEPGGIWTSLSLEKKLTKKWDISCELEFRTSSFSMERERLAFQLGTEYKIFKNIKLGTGYSYLNVSDDYKFSSDSIREHYQNRHRVFVQAAWKQKIGDFTFSLRERTQMTFKDESDRHNASGEINSNRINPDFIWRNRAKLSYNIKNFPVTPSCYFESYYLLNDSQQVRIYNTNQIDYKESHMVFTKLRYGLSLEYKINKKNLIEFYSLFSNERGAEEVRVSGPNYYKLGDWNKDFILGIAYTIQL